MLLNKVSLIWFPDLPQSLSLFYNKLVWHGNSQPERNSFDSDLTHYFWFYLQRDCKCCLWKAISCVTFMLARNPFPSAQLSLFFLCCQTRSRSGGLYQSCIHGRLLINTAFIHSFIRSFIHPTGIFCCVLCYSPVIID